MPEVVSAEQTTAGEVAVGTTFVQRGRFLGRTVETPTVVTSFEPHSRLGYRADGGPVPYEALYDFVPNEGGTLLDATVTIRLRGAARVFEPVLGRYLQRAYVRNLDRVRELLEA